jgi:hypothetical protein
MIVLPNIDRGILGRVLIALVVIGGRVALDCVVSRGRLAPRRPAHGRVAAKPEIRR